MAHESLTTVLRHLRHLIGARTAEGVSDGDLLQRFVVQHDESAFTTLMQRHGPLVLSVCRRLLPDTHNAEDAFQATFVVLIRRAASLRREGSLGSWLYAVAYRIALKARAGSARRHSREQQAEDMADATLPGDQLRNADPQTHGCRRELAGVLDDEVNRLPEKYRAPLVLCYLEGKTNEQAAQELGCPIGSMSWRLDKGRELLRRRLVGRGVTLSVGGFAAALAEQAVTAAVPSALSATALKTAVMLTAGEIAAGAMSAPVAVLANYTLHSMAAAKLRLVAVALLVLGLAGSGATVLAFHTLGRSDTATPPQAGPLLDAEFADWIDRRVEQWQPTKAERRIDDIGWAKGILGAQRLAKAHNRPVFLFAHVGRIGTGRCGGSAFNLRAFALADERVIALLNSHFVPVVAAQEDYGRDGTLGIEEKAALQRVYHATIRAKMHSGEDCVYILTPDGEPLDSLSIGTAKKADVLVERLQQAVAKLSTAASVPVVPPTSQSVAPSAAPDALVLHLTARAFNRKAWCEFPAENWIVLERDDWEQVVPRRAVAVRDSWDLSTDLTRKLLTFFYPQTENNDLATNRIDQQLLRATVIAMDKGIARIRLDGELRMKHEFYPNRPDSNFAEATLLGCLDFDVSQRRVRSLRLVTDQGTYGGHEFGVAVRSVP